MSSNALAGVLVGALMGIVSGFALLFMLAAAVSKSRHGGLSRLKVNEVTKLCTQLLALPTVWFGGSWVSGQITIIKGFDPKLFNPYYIIGLAICFGSISLLLLWPALQDMASSLKGTARRSRA